MRRAYFIRALYHHLHCIMVGVPNYGCLYPIYIGGFEVMDFLGEVGEKR